MAVTRDSLGLTEEAQVERSGSRRADFPAGSYVRTRHVLIDNDRPDQDIVRPLDYGQVRDGDPEGEFLAVRWSQAGCGCSVAQEDPSKLVAATEAEYLAFLAGTTVGYAEGFHDADRDRSRPEG